MKKYRTMRVTRRALPKRALHFKFIPTLIFLLLILVPVSILLATIPVNGKSVDTQNSGTISNISTESKADTSSKSSSTAAQTDEPISSVDNIQSSTAMDQKAQQLSSNTKYLIVVDLQSQTVGIYNGSKTHWVLVNRYQCSSGRGGNDATPTGTFTVQGKGTWFFNPTLQEGAEWWTQFSGDFLFHSLPMNQNHTVTDSTLGIPRSHGCIRLDIANAKWIYDNIPRGTKVYIY
jgi:Uncharacterized protein conserved in bacteria